MAAVDCAGVPWQTHRLVHLNGGVSARVTANQWLDALPPSQRGRLDTLLEPVRLERKAILCRGQEPLPCVYFPTTAVVSFVMHLDSGHLVEVGLVGRDGLVSPPLLPDVTTLPCDAIVQIPGDALRMGVDALGRELAADRSLASAIQRYVSLLLARSMHMAACNMFHPVEQRCIRWLLTVNDLTGDGRISLTHDLLATMLGVRRPTVSVVLQSLNRSGLIGERRGGIFLRDREALETACCVCYRAMRDEQRRILGY
jgi:CRP-like cAMP-binding protein